jgi:very-short-patch-repair endonuclease
MAAALTGGGLALISDHTGAELLGVRERRPGPIEVTTVNGGRHAGLLVHRRVLSPADRGTVRGIPVTSPARTLVDISASLDSTQLERSVNVADSLDLIDPEQLRIECGRLTGTPGVAKLRRLLDRHTFRCTDSVLEQRFLAIVRRAGLPLPETQRHADGFRVDFLWPALGLVVEVDSLRYHRTPAQQYRDRLRDQAHFDAGRTPRRFTHAQVFYEGDAVVRSLQAAARGLR